MRIAHIIFGLTGGGAETMLVNIANAQVNAGNDVAVFIINDYVEQSLVDTIDDRISVIMLNRRRGSRNPLPIINLNRRLIKFHPDIIHIHVPSIVRYLLPRFRRRTLTTLHSVVKTEDIPSLGMAARVCSISDHVADDLMNRFSLPSVVVMNGIGATRFIPRATMRKASNSLKIVCVARLFEVKGQHILIQALGHLRRLRPDLNVKVDFIGDGDTLDSLKQLAGECGVADCVSFLGYKSQRYIEQNMCRYDLMVLPSLSEGFGLSAAEGMAAAVETLVSSDTGSCDVVDNGACGYIFTNADPVDCALSIAGIADRDADPAMIAAARNRALALYDVSATAGKYLEQYKTIYAI